MSLNVKKDTKTQRPLPDEKQHVARCVRIIDLGTQEKFWEGKRSERPIIRFTFELVDTEHIFDEKKGPEPFVVSQELTASLNKKSNMYAMLRNWNKDALKKLEEVSDENTTLDMSAYLDAPCIIMVEHSEKSKDGIVYANIGSKGTMIMHRSNGPDGKDTEIKDAYNPKVLLDMDWLDSDYDKFKAVYDELYPFEQKKVQASMEYQATFPEKSHEAKKEELPQSSNDDESLEPREDGDSGF